MAGGIPRGVAARFEGGTKPAVREARGIGFALDELLAREGHDHAAVGLRIDEGIMLLARYTRKRLEPVREVGRTVFDGPFLHGMRYHVGNFQVERFAIVDGAHELLIGCLRQTLFHHTLVKNHRAVNVRDMSGGVVLFAGGEGYGLAFRSGWHEVSFSAIRTQDRVRLISRRYLDYAANVSNMLHGR